jgi:enolase
VSSPDIIKAITARRVWDSRGRPSVEVDVVLASGVFGRAIAPAGASRGSNEAIDLRDGGTVLGGFGVEKALHAIRTEIADCLIGRSCFDQTDIDEALIALDGTRLKSRLGGNATIATSMAVAHAAAAAAGLPLWRYLAGDRPVHLPMPMIQVFGGGAHAGRRIDVQDFLMIPIGAASFDQAITMTAEVYRAAGLVMQEAGLLRGVADEGGWWPEFTANEQALQKAVQAIERAGLRPGEDVVLAIDVAASQFEQNGQYHLAADGRKLDTAGLIDHLELWCRNYPILSLEDPLAETDHAGMQAVTLRLGANRQIIGDDYLVTSAPRVEAAAAGAYCNAVLIKPNQVGTLTETRAALDAGIRAGFRTIVSARSGETEDVTIVHLAVGWGADQLKVGSFARSERMAKWNEALRIEESLGRTASFVGRGAIGGLRQPGRRP